MKTIIIAALVALTLAASAVFAGGFSCFYTGEDTTQTKRLCHYLCPTAGNITTINQSSQRMARRSKYDTD